MRSTKPAVRSVQIKVRCMDCGRIYAMSASEEREARDIGCAISSCCQSISIVERVNIEKATVRRHAQR